MPCPEFFGKRCYLIQIVTRNLPERAAEISVSLLVILVGSLYVMFGAIS